MAEIPVIEPLTADEFDVWLRQKWRQGEHWAVCAPTGEGKTTLVVQMLGARKFVLALDPKGGDDTLNSTGWPRLTRWPPPSRTYDDMAEGKPARFLVGQVVRTRAELPGLRELQAKTLEAIFDDGKWTAYVDEAQLAGDPRFMALGTHMEELLISARSRKVSLITSFQRPARVPVACYEMATWIAIAQTMDRDAVNRCAEVIGRPGAFLRGALKELPQYHFLIASRNPREPLRLVHPRYAAPKKA